MNTQILEINDKSLDLAKKLIESGKHVAFPTETVYGLGANALDGMAVEEIFKIKGRPNDNPLIVHVHSNYDITSLVYDIPEYAKLLKEAFLPGPLTMVYKSKGKVSKSVSCGLDTLAIRIPSHSGAEEFLRYVNLPIAAPSANISKHVSPTTAQHVYNDLCGKIELILDGGKSSGGIESTVLDCTGKKPVVLRSGLITREMIAMVAGECDEYIYKEGQKALSPGMKYKHYSPKCETMMFSNEQMNEAVLAYNNAISSGRKAYILSDEETREKICVDNFLSLGRDEREIASNLYDRLREGEKCCDLLIAISPKKQDGIMVGVMNRLSKACRS